MTRMKLMPGRVCGYCALTRSWQHPPPPDPSLLLLILTGLLAWIYTAICNHHLHHHLGIHQVDNLVKLSMSFQEF